VHGGRGSGACFTTPRGRLAGPAGRSTVAPVLVMLLLTLAGCRLKEQGSRDSGTDTTPRRDAPVVTAPAPPPCARVPGSFAEVASRLAPSLVTLLGPEGADASPQSAFPLMPSGSSLSPLPAARSDDEVRVPLGTGFVVDGQRLVVTSSEVAGDAPVLWVRLADGRTVEATPRGVDPDLDLAVLSLESPLREGVAMTDAARVRPGNWVAVLGDPFGTGVTVTAGVVRALPSPPSEEEDQERPGGRFLSVDAAVDAANRGGPVVDAAARLVGMAVTSSSTASRMSLVLPASELRRASAGLVERGQATRAWIGLWVRSIDGERARELEVEPPRGLLVTRIVGGGPADVAGVRPDDVIVEFSGEPVSTPARLGALAARAAADQEVPVEIVRDGRRQTLRIRPAAMPQ